MVLDRSGETFQLTGGKVAHVHAESSISRLKSRWRLTEEKEKEGFSHFPLLLDPLPLPLATHLSLPQADLST